MKLNKNTSELKNQILALVAQFTDEAHAHQPFEPGISSVPVSGRVYGQEEMTALVESSLDFWLTTGRFNAQFESALKSFLKVPHLCTVNSGSSANLLAVAALTSPSLGDKALKPGDEVITASASFPTTVNPLLQYGLIPVFLDMHIPTYNVTAAQIESAITPKTKAIILAHTLGNPFEVQEVAALAKKNNLWLIEDCCDALGSTYQSKNVGTFGHIGTLSFYPAHHITTGEGGAVFTSDAHLDRLINSFRDWGRDCYCPPGCDNTCGKRFEHKMGSLPAGYDHKYIYSHAGYNLKMTDMQAAIGLAQVKNRLPSFTQKRKENFKYLYARLKDFKDFLILPEATHDSDPSWFGFPVTIQPQAPFTREELTIYLNEKKIGTRLLFTGNITAQPYFEGVKYRVHGELKNADLIMNKTFWLGVYPGISLKMLDYVADSIQSFIKSKK